MYVVNQSIYHKVFDPDTLMGTFWESVHSRAVLIIWQQKLKHNHPLDLSSSLHNHLIASELLETSLSFNNVDKTNILFFFYNYISLHIKSIHDTKCSSKLLGQEKDT